MTIRLFPIPSLACCVVVLASFAQLSLARAAADDSATGQAQESPKWGMSHHGSHYDEGPRSRPFLMDGIGKTHFPVTSSHPDVQKWFDQGHTLLHSFWPFEAERSFRWCLKLDPDCAMAYWGLSRCCERDEERAAKFLQQAVDRMDRVTPRERDYLELWVARAKVKKAQSAAQPTPEAPDNQDEPNSALDEARQDYVRRFDKLLMNYPDDIEARALYWLELPRTLSEDAEEGFQYYRFAMESVLQDLLKQDPSHVGALHYRIHNWDSREGEFALDSCLKLSAVAPNSGHLQHMPGHVLSGVGLWHEAAIAMDAATRVEKEYMHRHMIRPDQNWNYTHNLNYLCFIQEQLGMFAAARISLEQLNAGPGMLGVPPIFASTQQNLAAIRLLIKSEQWNEILDTNSQLLRFDPASPIDQLLQGYARTYALISLGQLEAAEKELEKLTSPAPARRSPGPPASAPGPPSAGKPADPPGPPPEMLEKFLGKSTKLLELEGKLLFAQGKHLEGIEKLTAAAQAQEKNWRNDPPTDPMFLYTTLGDAYQELGSSRLAIAAYRKTLETVAHDGFALSGLVRAHAALGETTEAQAAMAKLNAVWSDADPTNQRLQLARETGIQAKPASGHAIVERNYKSEVLDKRGHSLWTPPSAPAFSAYDASGKEVQLEDFAGKNLVLIFYLGGECLHCMEQMRAANRLASQFRDLDTEIVAISKDDRETIKAYAEDFEVTLLSDPDFSTSRAYHSFDDFEEIELHSTILIDQRGRVHWSQHGGEPFMNFDFLKGECEKLNKLIGNQQAARDATGDTLPAGPAETATLPIGR